MKILFLSRLFYPHIGGVEKHVAEISRILIEKGHEVTVLTEKYDKNLSDVEIINKIKIVRVDSGRDDWFKKFRIWKNVWSNRNLILESDIIHIHDVFFWILPFRLFVGKPIYMTFHGYEGDSIPGIKAKFMHKIAEKLSKGNICVGDFLKKWYGTKPDSVIYGGVNSQKSIKQKKPDGIIKFLFLGRLEEETGIMVYLQALKILKDKNYEFELTILGDGSLRKKAEEYVKRNSLSVKFKGFVENVEEFISGNDFIFTSRYLGILESLVLGKLVFAVYDNEIKKDYLAMSPFIKHISISMNSKNLSDQFEYFLENDQKKLQIVNGGLNWVRSQTWDMVASVYLRLWRKV